MVGGYIMGMWFITGVNLYVDNPLALQSIVLAVIAGTVGFGLGSWTVREWQEAGK
jgi:hypothetical protein